MAQQDRATGYGLGLPDLSGIPVPLFVLRPAFARLIRELIQRHPALFDRLGEYGKRRFLIDPVDLPFVLLLVPDAENPQLTPHPGNNKPAHDATISGTIANLARLLDGVEDGDALFFSRDLQIEGDTEAILALRNATDDMEIDLVKELEDMLGPLSGMLVSARRQISETSHMLQGLQTVLSETFILKTIDRSKNTAPPHDHSPA
jgi:predicted lipid carrier protein YhbT